MRSEEDEFTRPFHWEEEWNEKDGIYRLTIDHNGPVDFQIFWSGNLLTEIENQIRSEEISAPELAEKHYIETELNQENFTESSYHNYIRTLRAFELGMADSEALQTAEGLLISVEEAVKELSYLQNYEEKSTPEYRAYIEQWDRLIREILSPGLWYDGKDIDLRTRLSSHENRLSSRLANEKKNRINEQLAILKRLRENLK